MFSSNTSQVSGGYEIQRSLRFNSADGASLDRTPASATNRQTFTISFWAKNPSTAGLITTFYAAGSDTNNNETVIGYWDGLYVQSVLAGTSWRIRTAAVYRDPSAWYHYVFAFDLGNGTQANRLRVYVNGVESTYSAADGQPLPTTANSMVNSNVIQYIGRRHFSSTNQATNAYLTEFYLIDGQALTPSSFGAFDAQTGVWGPRPYAGSYGTNGFYLNFSDNSNTTAATLGRDYSGNGNNWTPNNFSVSAGAGNDSLVDVPTNWGTDTGVGGTVRGNYATWNPLVVNRPTLTNGNLDADGSDLKTAISTMGVSTGRWYWEILIRNGTDTPNMGVTSFPNDNADPGVYLGAGRSYVSSGGGGGIYKNYTSTSTVADSDFSNANTAGAIIGFALDCDAGTLSYYVNNVLGHTDTTIATGTLLYPMTCNFNSGSSAYRNTSANFGQRPFAYTAPSGFRALNTQNLPTPTIGATTATQAGKFFNPVIYTGNGSSQTISGFGFQPDLVWLKDRTNNGHNNWLFDVLRGAGILLSSNTTGAEINASSDIPNFTSDGFYIAISGTTTNQLGSNYVSWGWRANGAGVTNTAGSITSTVSANTTSGFSVVTYTGTGNVGTVGHGLGAVPMMIIVKSRSNAIDWVVYHGSIPSPRSSVLRLNLTDGVLGVGNYWGSSGPTSTTFGLDVYGGNNTASATYVAYCFAEVPGYSRIGSYAGNGSTDGAFVYTGFRPAFILVKAASGTNAQNIGWWIFDGKRPGYNVTSNRLSPNTTDAEFTNGTIVDFTANGFKWRDGSGGWNDGAITYIFAAFAEAPQKFAIAR